MAGRTGKMTVEAIAARGPRMCLYKVFNPNRTASIFVVGRYGAAPFTDRKVKTLQCNFLQVARSYTLSYLMGIARTSK